MKTKLVLVVLIFSSLIINAQSITSKRIKINNPSQAIISNMQKEGIDFRCGAVFEDNSIILDLAPNEVSAVKKLKIPYTVEINDLTKFYADRAIEDMPRAQNILKQEKAKALLKKVTSKTKSYQKKGKGKTPLKSKSLASITSVNIDSYLQYYGEQEVDWSTPTNFNIPSTFGGCLTVQGTLDELDQMRALYPGLITVKQDASPSNQKTYGLAGTGGWSGQTVYYVKISHDANNPTNLGSTNDANKPDILYTSMIHSRELSALMGNIYFMWYLLENYATDSAIKNLVDNNELFFVPIVNPDGLKWNEKKDPNGGGMNRTNLRGFSTSDPTNNSNYIENYGVDPNRNFDYLWGSAGDSSGSSGSYSSSTYRGPSAFSEPESQIMRDFILSKNFKTAEWMHSYANAIPHPYGGIPSKVSGREDEMARWHKDMTRYNRYISGALVLTPANGIADDWMLGGTADSNGSVGSGRNILATTVESGANDGSEGGFWPAPSQIIPIAKRLVRIQLMNAYYGGKYAKLHDLTPSNISNLTSNLQFGIERVGQTSSDFTVTVTPVSSNISSIGAAVTETGMSVLEQRNINIQLNLNSGISPNDKIEYKVALSNNDGIIYEANFEKFYQPTVLFQDNPDVTGLSNWTQNGAWTTTSSGSWSGTSIKNGSTPYANSDTKTLTTSNPVNLSGATQTLIQFYAKWDLERNYDFVELLGSPDGGTTWYNLNGKYNKPNSSLFTNGAHSTTFSPVKSNTNKSFENNNSSGLVYDGDQMDNWVMEEIVIDPSDNSELYGATNAVFRFRFLTDSNNRTENYSTTLDGFYFDDFRIISVQEPCVTSVPTGLNTSTITSTSGVINWNTVPSATYDLRYRQVGSSTWIDVFDLSTTSRTLSGLTPSTNYEVQIRSKCGAGNTSAYTSSSAFTTTAVNYCSSSGNANANDEYIGRVQLETIDNSSANEKYGDFTSQSTDLKTGNLFTITITPTWTGTVYNEGYSVWIDYNHDGDFADSGEQVWTNSASQTNPVSGSFTVPTSAILGPTRMRVTMKYNGIPTSCETIQYGEVEDYTVNIVDNTLGVEDEILNAFKLYPNPANSQITIRLPNTIQKATITISNTLGQKVYSEKVSDIYNNIHTINTNSFKTGIYFVTVNTDKGKATKKLLIQ